jgi:adsorption protein B
LVFVDDRSALLTLSQVTFVTLALVVAFVFDDIFIDILAFIFHLKPQELNAQDLQELATIPERPIAIIVANWHEADVIGRMVTGNNRRLKYSQHHFFIGVYPNDGATVTVAKDVAQTSANTHVVINTKNGPTSKGQMLNEIVRAIFDREKEIGIEFSAFLMHDSEDILHPLSLKLINRNLKSTDFLQTPIFSMDRPMSQLVGGTYIDEFAELHTKDLFVRQRLGAPVPSAGVGTAIRRELMVALMQNPSRGFLREDSLTEDYVLGMSAALVGFKTAFCCYFQKTDDGRDYIATREYFPSQFGASVRQKTRWLLGIVFQGWRMVPWRGNLAHKYFLYRDRRGPLNNLVAMACTFLTLYLFFIFFFFHRPLPFMKETWFIIESVIATVGAISRIFHRALAVVRVNGWKRIWAIPFRWPVGNVVNSFASIRAFLQYRRARLTGKPLQWVKTTHVLPEGFGES